MSKKRKTNEEKTKTKTKTKRERTDSFTYIVENDVHEICRRIRDIIDKKHDTYVLDRRYIRKKDAFGKNRHCWCVRNKKTQAKVSKLWSVAAYRSFYVWSVYVQKSDTEDNLKKVDRKGLHKYHHAHKCGVGDCCNPNHIRIISRKENETDKSWHYFLNTEDKREQFMDLYSVELKERNVW